MIEVNLNNRSNNPFYGCKNCLNLLQASTSAVSTKMLDTCWEEVKDSLEKRQMFFSLLFSIGDITARQHNIFKGVTKDSGGNSNREGFYTIFLWLKDNHKEQFIKFLNAGLFNEYQCFDTLFRNRVKTKGTKVLTVYNILGDEWYREELLKYIYKVLKGNNPYDKHLVAKFLTPPRMSKRASHNKMLEETKKVMEDKAKFLIELSKLMKWEYTVNNCYANFKGYRAWRKNYNGELESVLFSTNRINEFVKEQFIDWFGKLPAQARFRVKNKILYSKKINEVSDKGSTEELKWAKFIPWIKEWETYKETKQAEQRILEEKVRQNQATDVDKEKLAKVKKEAKVNIGATNFTELYTSIINNNVDALKLESFIQNKVNLPYNTLVLIDDSGSMSGAPFRFASFIASVCLYKNPDDDGRNLLGLFARTGRWFSHITAITNPPSNFLLRRDIAIQVTEPFVNPVKSFMENYNNINKFLHAVFSGGWTDISSIVGSLEDAIANNPAVKDALMNYPVWTIISDGEWNNCPSPEASLNDLFRKCERILGFKPFIIAMDITNGYRTAEYFQRSVERFSGIDNLIYIPSNPAQIEQFLTNFKDMEVFDIYTPLQSIFRSNRYEIIRSYVI